MLNPREPRRPMGTPRLRTERFEDNTGIFYWIGTNEGKTTSYNNPIDGIVGARMSTTAGNNHHNSLLCYPTLPALPCPALPLLHLHISPSMYDDDEC
jgi:hypothetical protein